MRGHAPKKKLTKRKRNIMKTFQVTALAFAMPLCITASADTAEKRAKEESIKHRREVEIWENGDLLQKWENGKCTYDAHLSDWDKEETASPFSMAIPNMWDGIDHGKEDKRAREVTCPVLPDLAQPARDLLETIGDLLG